MVLVMVSAVSCMFIGVEDQLRARYPRNVEVYTYSGDTQIVQGVHEMIEKVLAERVQEENTLHYRFFAAAGLAHEENIFLERGNFAAFNTNTMDSIRQLFIVPLEDYNRIMGKKETLKKDEVLLYQTKTEYGYDENLF